MRRALSWTARKRPIVLAISRLLAPGVGADELHGRAERVMANGRVYDDAYRLTREYP